MADEPNGLDADGRSTSGPSFRLLDLPVELVEGIVSVCKQKDLARLARASHACWSRLKVILYRHPKVGMCLEERGPNGEWIRYPGLRFVENLVACPELMGQIESLDCSPCIHDVGWLGFNEDALMKLLVDSAQSFVRLQKVILVPTNLPDESWRHPVHLGSFVSAVQNLPNLRTFELQSYVDWIYGYTSAVNDTDNRRASPVIDSVTDVLITSGGTVELRLLRDLASFFPNVRSLVLDYDGLLRPFDVSATDLQGLRGLSNLRQFCSTTELYAPLLWTAIGQHLPETLDDYIIRCFELVDPAHCVGQRLDRATTFVIVELGRLCAPTLVEWLLAGHFPRLRSLHFRPFFDGAALNQLSAGLRQAGFRTEAEEVGLLNTRWGVLPERWTRVIGD